MNKLEKDLQEIVAKAKVDVQEVETRLGISGEGLSKILPVLETVVTSINAALESGIVDGVMATIASPSVVAVLPNIEAVLTKVAADILVGETVVDEFNAATTPESKVQVLLLFIQKQTTAGTFTRNAVLDKILVYLLANVDNNKLDTLAYAAWLSLKKYLGA